jgi:hypothetical protein
VQRREPLLGAQPPDTSLRHPMADGFELIGDEPIPKRWVVFMSSDRTDQPGDRHAALAYTPLE